MNNKYNEIADIGVGGRHRSLGNVPIRPSLSAHPVEILPIAQEA